MMGYNDHLPDLFKKLVDDKATEEEVLLFLTMVREENASDNLHEEMEMLWKKVGEESESSGGGVNSNIFRRIKAHAPLVAAACTGILIALLWALFAQQPSSSHPKYVVAKADQAKPRVVYLGDGSKVTLNSGTVLRYPEAFEETVREVYLEGEAFFEVKHNPKKSFLVHTGKVTTAVLGTSFNVAAYEGMPTVAVTVITGKVGLKNQVKDGSVLLTPKQRGVFNPATQTIDVDSVDNLSDVIAWRTGKLVFSAVALEEVCLKLGYHFGVEVSIKDKQKRDMKISGSFSNQSLKSIVEAICELSQTRYTETSGTYVIQ